MKQFFKNNWMLILAILYLLSPIDFLPDIIPLLGYGDDLIVLLATLVFKYFQYARDENRKKQENVIEGEIVK